MASTKITGSSQVAEEEFEDFEEELEDFEEDVQEEFEDYEEEEIEEVVEDEDYEEIEEIYEEEIEPDKEDGNNDVKVSEDQKVQEEEEYAPNLKSAEEKSVNHDQSLPVVLSDVILDVKEESMPNSVLEVYKEEVSVPNLVREEENLAHHERVRLVVIPDVLQSVGDLEKIHSALSKFLEHWNSFNRSLESINSAIDDASSQHDACLIECEKNQLSEQMKEESEHSQRETHERNEHEKKEDRKDMPRENDVPSEVEVLCKKMSGKLLRMYIEANFSNVDRLRMEVPVALRQAPNPPKLVLEAIGKFYKQGGKTFNKGIDSHRRASILLLEYFVLSGLPTADSSEKEQSNQAAHAWYKRLLNEGLGIASAVDSLGLILFLACFGIPTDFSYRILGILLLRCRPRKKIEVLRKSSILAEKISGVIKEFIRGEKYVEAAELSCCFGLNDSFPPAPLLTSFIEKSNVHQKQEWKESRDFHKDMREASMDQLKAMRNVAKFLEDHKLDAHILAPLDLSECMAAQKRIANKDRKVEKNLSKRKGEILEKNDPKRQANAPHMEAPFPITIKTEQNMHQESNYVSPASYAHPQAIAYGGGISDRNMYHLADNAVQQQGQQLDRYSNDSVRFTHY